MGHTHEGPVRAGPMPFPWLLEPGGVRTDHVDGRSRRSRAMVWTSASARVRGRLTTDARSNGGGSLVHARLERGLALGLLAPPLATTTTTTTATTGSTGATDTAGRGYQRSQTQQTDQAPASHVRGFHARTLAASAGLATRATDRHTLGDGSLAFERGASFPVGGGGTPSTARRRVCNEARPTTEHGHRPHDKDGVAARLQPPRDGLRVTRWEGAQNDWMYVLPGHEGSHRPGSNC